MAIAGSTYGLTLTRSQHIDEFKNTTGTTMRAIVLSLAALRRNCARTRELTRGNRPSAGAGVGVGTSRSPSFCETKTGAGAAGTFYSER